MAHLLKNGICVSIVDFVKTFRSNLYAELLEFVDSTDPAVGDVPPPVYAVTTRPRLEGQYKLLDNWYYPLTVGQLLPSLPIWLTPFSAITLDLDTIYRECCRTLRIR